MALAPAERPPSRWLGLVSRAASNRLPKQGSAQRGANSTHEGTARRRFQRGRRTLPPLSEFALLGLIRLSSMRRSPSPGPCRGPPLSPLSPWLRSNFFGAEMRQRRRFSAVVVCRTRVRLAEGPTVSRSADEHRSARFTRKGDHSMVLRATRRACRR